MVTLCNIWESIIPYNKTPYDKTIYAFVCFSRALKYHREDINFVRWGRLEERCLRLQLVNASRRMLPRTT